MLKIYILLRVSRKWNCDSDV